MSSEFLSPIEDIIEDARNGRMYILIDDEDRENEGDVIIPAQMATPDAINFMAKHARGLICLAMTQQRISELGLPLMAQHNGTRHETAFTVSIEALEGVTTGISAHDRARTVSVATDPLTTKADITTPGHVFPLAAKDGGVLIRAGHTEAAVDVSRLAGQTPAGVICEIMNEDGTMARMPDLIKFAQFHGLKVGTIADLIAYRRQHDNLIEKTYEANFDSEFGGEYKLKVFEDTIKKTEHVALVKGDISGSDPTLVRMHAINIMEDVLGEKTPHSRHLHQAMEIIGEHGSGVIVLIRDTPLSVVEDSQKTRKKEGPRELRDYGVGAQILLALGVSDMELLSNTETNIVGLEGYGIRIVSQRAIK